MGFWGINEQNKQRINLSNHANNVVEYDAQNFNQKSKNELINKVIRYIEKHNLTKERELDEYREEVTRIMSLTNGIDNISEITRQLTALKKEEIITALGENKTHKRNQSGQYFRISNAARKWLESDTNHEDEFYTSLEHFLNTILEDYAGKSSYERECIIFDEKIEELNLYILGKNWINVYFSGSTTPVTIFPVKILSDDNNMYPYLACFQLNKDGSTSIASYRIARFPDDIRIVFNGRKITDSEYSDLERRISESGIMFLADDAIDISVKMTPRSIDTYERARHLRPAITSIDSKDPSIYHFRCTEFQAEKYFIRFADEIEILAPESLRVKFHQKFVEAAAIYERAKTN